MKNQAGFRALAGLGAGLLLLGTAWLAQAAITITDSRGWICTDGTVNVSGTVTPVGASCHDPSITTYTLTVTKVGAGLGTISGTGLTCDSTSTTCTATYTASTPISVTLTAAPTDGSTIAWTGDCTASGTTCTISQAIAANLAVTATFTPPPPPPPPGSCGALPANTTVIDSGGMDTSFAQQTYYPPPQTVTAFKMTVPAGFANASYFSAIPTSASPLSKLWVVSTCPGVLQPVGNQAACLMNARTDTNTMNFSANPSAASYYCKLTAGQTYYFNAVSKNKLTDATYNCTTTTNCSFFGSRGSPY